MRQVDCCRPHPPFPALATTWGLPVTTPPRRGGEVLGIQAEAPRAATGGEGVPE
ncbi:hypothetical protein SLI_1218 [Streptomyces lividans 1326]|uniref:Uncharacterized protein n=1 Tax=Streptomyces lividans 1326 TaxID=1200984 RepID=A0A7U9DP83_STRLI|nr:hypothetical protein SLI_1218 [Streptomyces lividans 1326]